jgi:hypothetical protein
MATFRPGQRVLCHSTSTTPKNFQATIVRHLRNNLYQLRLNQGCDLFDAENGEIVNKKVGETIYAETGQLEKIEKVIVLFPDEGGLWKELERRLRAFAELSGWEFEIGNSDEVLNQHDCSLPCILTPTVYVGVDGIDYFLENAIRA